MAEKSLSAKDINAGIPGGGVDPRNAAAYLNSDDPRLVEAARRILLAQSSGEMDLNGNPTSAIIRREESTRLTTKADKKVTDKLEQEAYAKKVKANQAAEKSGYQLPYPNLTAEKPASVADTENKTLSKTQSSAASAAALGLSTSDLTRPSTVVEKVAKDATEKSQTPVATLSKGNTSSKDKKISPAKPMTIDEIIDAVANEYGSIDTIFKTDPGLQALLRKAIGKDGVPNTDDDLTPDQFVKELENTDWFKTNAGPVRQRGFYKRQFDDLVAGGSDPEELYKTTEYGRGLKNTQQVIADEIVKVGGNLSPEDIEVLSRDIYDLGYENQKAIVSQRIRAKISYKPGAIVSGQAGVNLADLRKTAKANGLDLEKNFGDSVQGWLQKLAQGESIETFKQIIRGSAKIGLPEKVSSLLDQGVDLDTVYNPYKRLMASVLEINPETITLDDSVLRSAIGPDKEMSLYDFQKMLRKDNRWQYTNQAKEEVSNTALRVLRDFGFQG